MFFIPENEHWFVGELHLHHRFTDRQRLDFLSISAMIIRLPYRLALHLTRLLERGYKSLRPKVQPVVNVLCGGPSGDAYNGAIVCPSFLNNRQMRHKFQLRGQLLVLLVLLTRCTIASQTYSCPDFEKTTCCISRAPCIFAQNTAQFCLDMGLQRLPTSICLPLI